MTSALAALQDWRLAEQDLYFIEHRWRAALLYEDPAAAQRLKPEVSAARERNHQAFRKAMEAMRAEVASMRPQRAGRPQSWAAPPAFMADHRPDGASAAGSSGARAEATTTRAAP
jgi:hypothetical protein